MTSRTDGQLQPPEHIKREMPLVEELFAKLDESDRTLFYRSATRRMCQSLDVPENEIGQVFEDPDRRQQVIEDLQAQGVTLFMEHEKNIARNNTLNRRIGEYLGLPESQRSDIRPESIFLPKVREAVLEAMEVMTYSGEVADSDLDDSQQALFHHHVTAGLLLRQESNWCGDLDFARLETIMFERPKPRNNSGSTPR